MPSFLSGRQRSQHHSQHQQQQQQQQLQQEQQQPPPTFVEQSSGAAPSSASPFASLATLDSSASSYDGPQKQQQPQQYTPQQQQRLQQLQQQQQQGRPPSFTSSGSSLSKNNSTSSGSHQLGGSTANTGTGGSSSSPVFDTLQKPSNADYLDQVSRSQSQRYPAQAPLQSLQHYAAVGASSADDVSLYGLQDQFQQQQQQQQAQQRGGGPQGRQPAPPPPAHENRRGTRKLFKNLLGGGSGSSSRNQAAAQQQQQQQPSIPPPASQNAHNNTSGLARRPSKRLSQPQPQPQPPTLRTGQSQVSQVSTDSIPGEWPQPQQFIGVGDNGNALQQSPHPGGGEFSQSYAIAESHEEQLFQDQPPPTIRRVGTSDLDSADNTPYSADSIGRRSSHSLLQGGYVQHLQQQQNQQGPSSPESQTDNVGVAYTTNTSQTQRPVQLQQPPQQYPAAFQQAPNQAHSPHQNYLNTLNTASLQHPQQLQQQQLLGQKQANPETLSQVSRESPVGDVDQQSLHNVQSSQTSPAGVAYSPQQLQHQLLLQHQAALAPTPPPPAGQPLQHPPPLQPQPGQQTQQAQQQKHQTAQQSPGQQTTGQNIAAAASASATQKSDSSSTSTTNTMAPGGALPNRRSQDTTADRSGSLRGDGPPSYRHSQAAAAAAGTLSPLPPGSARPGNDQRQFEGEGRSSPQPGTAEHNADSDKQFKELALKYKNVKRLYFEGKAQIDQLTGQIEHLQNAIANQRMSQSRTALDDSEYSTRFNRLNGAINNLSFNIRKDWASLPSWIEAYASADALKTGKQEMTAVGRAVITRWLVESIFNCVFHPGLDPELSRHLKEIELNIRRFSYKLSSQEEFDALTYKIVSWRMATLEGLQAVLSSPESDRNRTEFTHHAATGLTDYLCQYLTDPAPPGVDGSASMIVELAVGITFNLPMESRDVAVTFPLPMDNVTPHLMELEKAGLPPLDNKPADDGAEPDDDDDDDEADAKSGRTRSANPSNDMPKVRFAGFFAVEVRGRQVLVKAPVWAM